MAERKAFSVKLYDSELEAIKKMADEKGMRPSEYMRDCCLKQNEHIGHNILQPLCEMRKELSKAKYVLGWGNKENGINDLIKKLEGSCDQLWKSVNL